MATAIELMRKRRTIRKFTQEPLPHEALLTCVDCARLSPTSANLQALKFKVVETPELCAEVFTTVLWAGYLRPNGTPQEGERPTAYIVTVQDTSLRAAAPLVDMGAAMLSMILAAEEQGIATTWIGSVDHEKLHDILKLPEHCKVLEVLALGYPAQKAQAVPMQDGDVRYWLEEDGTLSVPKRSLEEILL